MIIKVCEGFEINFVELNETTFNCHIDVVKPLRGSFAVAMCKEVINTIFKLTNKTKLVVFIPAYQRHIRLFLNQIGLRQEGVITKDSEEYKAIKDPEENKPDIIIFSISKERE